jgi:CRISPR/Cas system type I-B associated protein Csh2 (Cas7 group RAMP superfamily)
LVGAELKTSAEHQAPKAAEKKESAVKAQPDAIPATETKTIASKSGGVIMYSIDGDTAELSVAGSTNATDAQVQAQTAPKTTETADAEETEEAEEANSDTSPAKYDGNSNTKAYNLFIQGYSDSQIKDKTGVSQKELDKIKESLDKTTEEVVPA